MEVVKSENIKQEVTDEENLSKYKVISDTEYMEQMTSKCDIPPNKKGLELTKYEENVKEEGITTDDTEMNLKTELKYEVDIVEHGLSYEQLRPIKTEDSGNGQYVDIKETAKQNVEKDTFDCIVVDMGKKNVDQKFQRNFCDYEMVDEAREYKNEINIERHQTLLPAHEVEEMSTSSTHIKATRDSNLNYYRCKFCKFITKQKVNLGEHFTRKHGENVESYRCSNCEYKTKVKHDLVKHCRMHHNKETKWHQCHLCHFKTKYKYNLSLHRRSQHDEAAPVFICERCDFKTITKTSLLLHHIQKHGEAPEIFQCEVCDFKTKYKKNLLLHHKLKHDDAAEIFYCERCDFKTKHKRNFLMHHKSKHDDAAEIFYCERCDFKTKYKNSLLRHDRSKHDEATESRLSII